MPAPVDPATIGILYPGDMGAALGRLLIEKGHRVVTTLEGRSARTARLAADAGLEILHSLRDVVQQADLLLSLVSPTAALAVAEAVRSNLSEPSRCKYLVDLNSISPDTALQTADLFPGTPVQFVDGAVHGLASQLRERGMVYLSGPGASAVQSCFEGLVRVRVLGEEIGQASALRMLISGLTKGLNALFLEMSLVAARAGLLDELLACYRESYAGVMEVIDRIFPTYPRHASRRAEEMKELTQMMKGLSLQPRLVDATQSLLETMGGLHLDQKGEYSTNRAQAVRQIVQAAQEAGLLDSGNIKGSFD